MEKSVKIGMQDPKFDWRFMGFWIGASTGAIVVGFIILYGSIFLLKAVISGLNEDRLFGPIMFPLLSIMLGFFQWIVLRRRIAKAGWWIVATVLGLVAGIAIAAGIIQGMNSLLGVRLNSESRATLILAIVGFFLALGQMPVLYRHSRGWLLWLIAGTLGYLCLGLVLGKSIDRTSDIIALGAIPAAFTGLALQWLLRAPDSTQSTGETHAP